MAIKINIKFEEEKWLNKNVKKMAKKAFEATFRSLSREDLLEKTEISILACNDQAIRSFNKKFRGINFSTNVLSWPRMKQLGDKKSILNQCNLWGGFGENDILDLGDIAISYDTCSKQAQELGIRLENHVLHLLIHACLHLLGFKHQKDSDFKIMKELEIRTLKSCGIQNPYS